MGFVFVLQMAMSILVQTEPLSPALRPMAELVGTWELTPIQTGRRRYVGRATRLAIVTVEPILGGKFLIEKGELDLSAGTVSYVLLLGYDPFQETYRLSWNDSLAGLADIYEGDVSDGVLMVDNLGSEDVLANAGRHDLRVPPRVRARRETR